MPAAAIEPMLAKAVDSVPGGDCIMEAKQDGWRAIAHLTSTSATLRTRSGATITSAPYLLEALEALPVPRPTILDGEIVDLHASAGKEWNRTQSILSRNEPHVPKTDDPALTYVIFDLLEMAGKTTMLEPLRNRKQLLEMLRALIPGRAPLTARAPLQIIEPFETCDEATYDAIVAQGFEGVVCKQLDSIYQPGARGPAWVKLKPELEMDCEVTGTYPPEARSKYDGNSVGGITFRTPEGYEGRCAGMDDDLRRQLHDEPAVFIGRQARIVYQSVGAQGALRFPRFDRFRDRDDTPTQPPAQADSSKRWLLERVEVLEDENEQLRAENADLRIKLRAAMRIVDGEKPNGAEPPEEPPPEAKRTRASTAGKRMRNFKAMSNAKLLQSVADLEHGSGEAHGKALAVEHSGGPTVSQHLIAAQAAAKARGLI